MNRSGWIGVSCADGEPGLGGGRGDGVHEYQISGGPSVGGAVAVGEYGHHNRCAAPVGGRFPSWQAATANSVSTGK